VGGAVSELEHPWLQSVVINHERVTIIQ